MGDGRYAADPVSAGALAWVVPGAGHLLLGRYGKAALYFVLVVGTFIAGWIIAGRVNVYFGGGRWQVLVQLGSGAVAFLLGLGRPVAEPKVTVDYFFDLGTLYTMVAGLLNVLVVMDAVVTSIGIRKGTR